MIGRFVDVTASAMQVEVRCEGRVVARHRRCWARHTVTTDPDHQATAAQMRRALAAVRVRAHVLLTASVDDDAGLSSRR